MSLNLTNIFTELGSIFAAINQNNTYRTSVTTRYNLLYSQYESVGNQNTFDGYLSVFTAFQTSQTSFLTRLSTLAQNTLIGLVNSWQAQPNSTLANAVTQLILQMEAQSASINAYTVSNSTSYTAGNSGNAVVAVSTIDNYGQVLAQQYAETITGTCTRDSNSGGATVGNESWALAGQASDPNGLLDFNFPMGSGSTINLTAIAAANTTGNLLSGNGAFNTWTSGVPSGWTTSSTTYVQQGTTTYQGTYSVKFVGNASDQYCYYNFPTALSPSTIYSYNLWYQLSANPASGTMIVCLQDQLGNILNTGTGNQNAILVNLHGLATGSWINLNGFFATPAISPSTGFRLYIGTSSPLSTGTNLFVDSVSFGTPTRLGSVGAYYSMLSGNATTISGDTLSVTTVNNGNPSGDFQRMLFRTGIISGSTLLPSSGSPTISNSLIA